MIDADVEMDANENTQIHRSLNAEAAALLMPHRYSCMRIFVWPYHRSCTAMMSYKLNLGHTNLWHRSAFVLVCGLLWRPIQARMGEIKPNFAQWAAGRREVARTRWPRLACSQRYHFPAQLSQLKAQGRHDSSGRSTVDQPIFQAVAHPKKRENNVSDVKKTFRTCKASLEWRGACYNLQP